MQHRRCSQSLSIEQQLARVVARVFGRMLVAGFQDQKADDQLLPFI